MLFLKVYLDLIFADVDWGLITAMWAKFTGTERGMLKWDTWCYVYDNDKIMVTASFSKLEFTFKPKTKNALWIKYKFYYFFKSGMRYNEFCFFLRIKVAVINCDSKMYLFI